MTISRMLILYVLFIAVFMGTNSVAQYEVIEPIIETGEIVQYVPEPIIVSEPIIETEYPEHWTCFDHAVYWSEKYPGWGMVLMSKNPKFEGYNFGDNHLVNYKILPDKTLLIHDGTRKTDKDYLVAGWEFDSCTFEYYHFYVNGEVPTRTWTGGVMYPNAEAVYNAI